MLSEGEQVVAESAEARAADFERLIGDRLDETYRLARLILRNPEEAADATHDAFIRAWGEYPRLRNRERFDAWFGRILVNACRDRLRRASHRRHDGLDEATRTLAAHDAHRAVDERDAIGRAFRALNADQRVALVLRYYGDFRVEDIAHAVGAPVGTVRSRIHYGIRELKRALELAEQGPDR